MFTLIYSSCSGLEHASLAKVIGVLVVVSGCTLVTVGGADMGRRGSASASWKTYLGVGVLVVQCISFVGLVLVQKPLVARYPVSWVIGWSYVLCTGWTCIAALLDGEGLSISMNIYVQV